MTETTLRKLSADECSMAVYREQGYVIVPEKVRHKICFSAGGTRGN